MDTIKQTILRHLADNRWHWGGQLSLDIALSLNHKPSVVERRCRELVEDGKIEAEYAQVNGKGPKCVRYHLREPIAHRVAVRVNPTSNMFA